MSIATHTHTQVHTDTRTHKRVHFVDLAQTHRLAAGNWQRWRRHCETTSTIVWLDVRVPGLREPLYSDTTTCNALQCIRNWHVTWPDNLPLPVGRGLDRALQVGQKLRLHVANGVLEGNTMLWQLFVERLRQTTAWRTSVRWFVRTTKGLAGFFFVFFYTQQPKTENDLIAKTRKERRAPDQQRHHAEELIGHGGAWRFCGSFRSLSGSKTFVK